jgi:hypothetical protein
MYFLLITSLSISGVGFVVIAVDVSIVGAGSSGFVLSGDFGVYIVVSGTISQIWTNNVEVEKWFDPAFQEFIDKEIASVTTKQQEQQRQQQ